MTDNLEKLSDYQLACFAEQNAVEPLKGVIEALSTRLMQRKDLLDAICIKMGFKNIDELERCVYGVKPKNRQIVVIFGDIDE